MALAEYRATLTREDLGFVLYASERNFRPVHRVLSDPENGPVIIINNEVFEVDPEGDEVYRDDLTAMDAYYLKKEQR